MNSLDECTKIFLQYGVRMARSMFQRRFDLLMPSDNKEPNGIKIDKESAHKNSLLECGMEVMFFNGRSGQFPFPFDFEKNVT